MTRLLQFSLMLFLCVDLSVAQRQRKLKHIEELPYQDKSIVFSDLAIAGKVTVFIVSTHGCRPCVVLKNNLNRLIENGSLPKDGVKIYLLNLTATAQDNLSDYDEKGEYRHYKYVDKLTESFPTTLIFTQTKNFYHYFKGDKTKEISKLISELYESGRKYFKLEYLNGASNKNLMNESKGILDTRVDDFLLNKKVKADLKKAKERNVELSNKVDSLTILLTTYSKVVRTKQKRNSVYEEFFKPISKELILERDSLKDITEAMELVDEYIKLKIRNQGLVSFSKQEVFNKLRGAESEFPNLIKLIYLFEHRLKK